MSSSMAIILLVNISSDVKLYVVLAHSDLLLKPVKSLLFSVWTVIINYSNITWTLFSKQLRICCCESDYIQKQTITKTMTTTARVYVLAFRMLSTPWQSCRNEPCVTNGCECKPQWMTRNQRTLDGCEASRPVSMQMFGAGTRTGDGRVRKIR